MLEPKEDAVSSAASIEPLNPMIESEPVEEEDDDWVIVKKRKITILIPPAPPVDPQSQNPEMKRTLPQARRTVKRSSIALNRRRHKHLMGKRKKPSVIPSSNGTQTKGNSLKAQESHFSLVAPLGNGTQVDGSKLFNLKLTPQQLPVHVCGDGNAAVTGKLTVASWEMAGFDMRPPVGALSVVNRRLRALNLKRRLKGLGGLRSWLLAQGLERFVRVFEREKINRYQLANLTMSKLKDMGTDAVGPRRKLIHAIDSLPALLLGNLAIRCMMRAHLSSIHYRTSLSSVPSMKSIEDG